MKKHGGCLDLEVHFASKERRVWNSNTKVGSMKIQPLSPALGAEILNVDLSQPTDNDAFSKIKQAWIDHLIILFRDQSLDEHQQAAFCGRFGTLVASVKPNLEVRKGQHPAVMYVSNIKENGKLIGSLPDGEMYFHSDQCHSERPAMATMLYAMEIPSKGGDTLFANMYRAYETLPNELKEKLSGRIAENIYDYQSETLTRRGSKIGEGVKHYAHPVFRTHPKTQRKARFMSTA